MNPNQPVTLEQQVFIENVKRFQEKLALLEAEIGIKVVPILQFSPEGVIPIIQYADKKQYDLVMTQMQKTMTGPQPNVSTN